ncbi:MAG: MBL fold metallo-hydrolase [Burkholderiaceae bacterium]
MEGSGGTDDTIRHWGAGIYSVDSGYIRAKFDAIHLIVERGRAAIVDSATSHSVPRVLAALDAVGVGRDQVDWVLLTHVHLDHAGGAGALLRELPAARLTVHPRGRRHMVDPSKLWQATIAVYGKAQAESLYGEIVPIAAERIVETGEGATIDLAGRRIEFIDTPGHARHHVVLRDTATGHLFAGDMFGVSYRELDVHGRPFVIPSSTPVQFDPDDSLRSIERMLALAPQAIYLTHFAEVRHIPQLGQQLQRHVRRYAEIATAAVEAERTIDGGTIEATLGARPGPIQQRIDEGLKALYLADLRAHGSTLSDEAIWSLLEMDLRLNSAGLVDWLRGRAGRQR